MTAVGGTRAYSGDRTTNAEGAMAATTTMSQRMRDCLDECENCARVCAETMSYCLQMGSARTRRRSTSA
jgi:hypothetical protein